MNLFNKRINRKQMLYTLCFVALMIIDWTRCSQVGSTWAWTVNMTGVIMAIIILSAYRIRDFMKPVYIGYTAIGILALPVSYYWWNAHQALIYRDQLLSAVLNVWLLGILVIKAISDVLVERKVRLKFSKAEIVTAVLLLYMFFSVNEDIWPLWFLVIFGLFFHTEYGTEPQLNLVHGMLDGIVLGFGVIQGLALLFRPFDEPRYLGMYANYNMNSLFYVVVFVAVLCKLVYFLNEKRKLWTILYMLLAMVVFDFQILTLSRTGLITSLVIFGIWLIYILKEMGRLSIKQLLGKGVLGLIGICVVFPLIFGAVRYIPTILHHPVWYEGEYSEDKVHSFDPWNSEKYTDFTEFTDSTKHTFGSLLNIVLSKTSMQVEAREIINNTTEPIQESVLSSTTIRKLIWRMYLENATWYGHSNTHGHYQIERYYQSYHAQNVFIQVLYFYGIGAGILCTLLLIFMVSKGMKEMLRRTGEWILCIAPLFTIAYIVFGLMEAVWYPGQIILLLIFLTQKFAMSKKE